jgi:hypothetical protein
MNLLQRITRALLSIAVHKTPPLTRTQDSIATPLGLKSYRDVNEHASLDEGVQRARDRRYAERGKHDER